MKKIYSVILALLFTLLIAGDYYLFTHLDDTQRETVFVSRVIDGDTLELEDGRTVRLLNINSPEKSDSKYLLAFDFLRNLENRTVEIETESFDKYGRVLARIYSPEYINLELVKKGLASKFLVSDSEIKTFSRAEDEAVRTHSGIWGSSPYYGCFNIDINKNDEYLVLENACGEINMKGFMLKDESRKQYFFYNFKLPKFAD